MLLAWILEERRERGMNAHQFASVERGSGMAWPAGLPVADGLQAERADKIAQTPFADTRFQDLGRFGECERHLHNTP